VLPRGRLMLAQWLRFLPVHLRPCNEALDTLLSISTESI
jgi:hypothetical protein